jgi:hypothetical protein
VPRKPHHSRNWGGPRANSGRRSPDKYSRDLVKRAHEEGIHPYDLLIKVVRDEQAPMRDRMYCAGTLLPYCAQKLVQTEIKVTNELDNLSMAEKVALAASMRTSILEQRPNMTLPQLPAIEGEFVNVTD